MLDRTEFQRQMERLLAAFDKPMKAAQVTEYHRSLRYKIEPADWPGTIDLAIENAERFPSVTTLLAMARDVRGRRERLLRAAQDGTGDGCPLCGGERVWYTFSVPPVSQCDFDHAPTCRIRMRAERRRQITKVEDCVPGPSGPMFVERPARGREW